jgi:hypothetical protein
MEKQTFKSDFKKFCRWAHVKWIRRHDTKLYDDVWRAPNGFCVNDDGDRWDRHWQKIIKKGN